MFRTHRTIYNKLVKQSKNDCNECFRSTSDKQFKFLKKQIHDKYRPISQKHSLDKYLPKYHLKVPEEVMDSTFRDFIKSIDSAHALYKVLISKNKNTSFSNLKFKSWKDNSSSIEIRSRSLKSSKDGMLRLFPKYFDYKKDNGMSFNGTLPFISSSVRLQRTRNQKYYLCIPQELHFSKTESNRICAIDPGVRDFITLYDPQGLTFGITDSKEHIFNRCLYIDRLKSKLDNLPKGRKYKRNRYRIRKTIYNLYQRIKCMINDMHQKTSKWISNNYNEVLLPKFETSNMTSKQKRISSKTSRAMLTWSHYKFKKMLEYKLSRTGGRVIECSEYFSSKTCSKCGRKNNNITHQKIFTCPSCNHTLDRDVNAARNIFMMNEDKLTWTNLVQALEKPTLRSHNSSQVINQSYL